MKERERESGGREEQPIAFLDKMSPHTADNTRIEWIAGSLSSHFTSHYLPKSPGRLIRPLATLCLSCRLLVTSPNGRWRSPRAHDDDQFRSPSLLSSSSPRRFGLFL